jgi:phosphoribosyl-ATP pyrophosphohydrolase
MAKRRKAPKADEKERRNGRSDDHALDRLYLTIDSLKGAYPDSCATARLFSRGSRQIAKKLGEEAVETVIEALRGDRDRLVMESADLLYHLLVLWSASEVEPTMVWAELGRRQSLLGPGENAADAREDVQVTQKSN